MGFLSFGSSAFAWFTGGHGTGTGTSGRLLTLLWHGIPVASESPKTKSRPGNSHGSFTPKSTKLCLAEASKIASLSLETSTPSNPCTATPPADAGLESGEWLSAWSEDCASDAGILRLAKSTPEAPEYVRRGAGQGSNVTSLQAGQGEARRLACAEEARKGRGKDAIQPSRACAAEQATTEAEPSL